MNKMYIRIDGDDDGMGASYEIKGSVFFSSKRSSVCLNH